MAAQPPPDDDDVPSPCIRQCCLDDDEVCLGCGRHVTEIMRWGQADAGERRRILALSEPRRLAKRARFT